MMNETLDLAADARRFTPLLADYDPRLRLPAIETWRARMVNEYCSAQVFEALASQLANAGLGLELVEECRGFAVEERRHGVLCGAVVLALGGEACAGTPTPAAFPLHREVSLLAAALRNLIHVCCLSETVAVSLIGEEREQMPSGALRELLTLIYADEIGHARFGWRLLERCAPELSPADRGAIEAYLPVAFAHLEHHELSHLPEVNAPAHGNELGLCSGREARALFHETVASIVRPGLRRWFRC